MSEYLSIKDFADRAGVTTSAVYQRLDKDLKPYLKIVENKKMLDSQALKLYELNLSDTLKELQQIEQESIKIDPGAYIEDLKAQINVLQDELSKALEHSRKQSDTISELALRSTVLLAAEKQTQKPKFFERFKLLRGQKQ